MGDPELKANIEEILTQLGMNTTRAINMFLKQLELRRGLPFDVRLPAVAAENEQRVSGLHYGVMEISDDFDTPLEDAFWLGDDA
jgi:addiction module RelB/DinJ family antitoxin